MSAATQIAPLSPITRILDRSREPAAEGTVKGAVISDTHIGATYSKADMAQGFFKDTLDLKKDTKFCVLLGDIFEVVNHPAILSLPVSEHEALAMRKKVLFEYISDHHIALAPAARKNLAAQFPAMSAEDISLVLGNEPGSAGESAIMAIYQSTRLRRDAENELIEPHIRNLRELVESHPDCTFYYVVGNHERTPVFLNAVRKLERELKHEAHGKDRLVVTEKYVKLGDALFVHGDQQMDPESYTLKGNGKFAESMRERSRPRVVQIAHDWLNATIPFEVGEQIHRANQCAANVIGWFHKNNRATLDGVTHVFMGHTHFPFTNMKVIDAATTTGGHVTYCAHPDESIENNPKLVCGREFMFHNTGAALQKQKYFSKNAFNPLEITLNAPQSPAGPDDRHPYSGYTVGSVKEYGQPEFQRA